MSTTHIPLFVTRQLSTEAARKAAHSLTHALGVRKKIQPDLGVGAS